MKNWLSEVLRPWFIMLLMVAFMHQFIEKLLHIPIPVIDSYLDPLLFMPILLHLLLWERRLLFKKGDAFTFSNLQLVLLFIAISFITEYLFPIWKPQFTADIWDVVCYALGTIYFRTYHNVSYQKQYKQHISTP